MAELSDMEIAENLEAVSMISSFILPCVLKAAVSLGIFDVLYKAGKAVSFSEIMSQLAASAASSTSMSENITKRLLRALVRANVLEENPAEYFALTGISKWFATDQPLSLVPLLNMMLSTPFHSSFSYLHEVATEGGTGFEKANGMSFYELAGHDQDFNKILNEGMNSFSGATMSVVLKYYMGFNGIKKLVDVGGGSGMCMRRIMQAYPGIQGTVFDLPHVIDDAPRVPGIEYVGGDMFESVPAGDAIFIKSIFHNWNDDRCLVLLKNCYKALPVNGKLIIVDMVCTPGEKVKGMDLDVVMIGITGGQERSANEWNGLLVLGGFSRVKFVYLPTSEGVVEAHKI